MPLCKVLHKGKTHLAVSLGVEAVKARKLTYFVDCQRLVSDLERAADKGQLERRMRFYSHLSLLVIDEVGYLEVGKRGADLLFQLVSRRYERRSTIVTTNVGIGSWAKVFGDPVVASAIADKLCEASHKRSYAKHCIMRSQREGTQARGPMRLRRLCIMCIAV